MISGEDIKKDNTLICPTAKRSQIIADNNNMLPLSVIENADIELNLKNMDICSWISSVIEDVQTKYNNAEKEIQIIFEIMQSEKASSLRQSHCSLSAPIFVLHDPVKVNQVLFKLFDNAIMFSKHQGIVICSILYSYDHGNVIISITDIPKGIDVNLR
jgi:signal transduction histidine kinase